MKKIFKVLPCACLLLAIQPLTLLSPVAFAKTSSYSDMSQAADWAKPAIERASEIGLVTGYENSSYKPLAGISRAEVAAIMVRALKLDVSSGTETGFKDVSSDSWYSPYIKAASKAGLMNGVGKGNFDPNRSITREELAALWVNSTTIDLTGDGPATPFRNWNTEKGTIELDTSADTGAITYVDADSISDWAKPYIQAVNRLGLMFNQGNEFDPRKQTQRQELALAIMEFLPQYGQMTIDNIQGDVITTDGTTYQISDKVKGLLRETNLEALKHETIRFETEGNMITNISYLSLGKNGNGASVVLDCGGTKIDKLRIYNDKVTINHAIVGDIVLPDSAAGKINLKDVQVTGNKMIKNDTGLWPESKEKNPSNSSESKPTQSTSTTNSGSESGSNSGGSVSKPDINAATISVSSEDNIDSIKNDQTLQLSAEVLPENSTDKSVTWSVSTIDGNAVASVNDKGQLSITSGTGIVQVKATSVSNGLVYGIKNITVTAAPVNVTSINVSSEENVEAITNAQTLQMSAEVLPENATVDNVTWSVSTLGGDAVANIDDNGLLSITGGTGMVQVKATSADNSSVYGTKDIMVTAAPVNVTSINVSSEDNVDSIMNTQTLQMSANVLPENATVDNVTWSVSTLSGNAVATIDNNGLLSITAGMGLVQVKATSVGNGFVYGTKNITVTSAPVNVTSINVSSAENVDSITNAQTLQMSAEVLPENATVKSVTWSVSTLFGDVEATVNDSGVLSINRGTGIVQVRATSVDNETIYGIKGISVTAAPVNVSSINVSSAGNVDSITNAQTLQMSAEVLPENATDKNVTWSVLSVDPGVVATISETGLLSITGGTGTVRVKATSVSNSKIKGLKDIMVTDSRVPVSGISVTTDDNVTTMFNNQTVHLNVTLTPDNATNSKYTWYVANSLGDVSGSVDDSNVLHINSGSYGKLEVYAKSVDNVNIQNYVEIVVYDQNVTSVTVTSAGNRTGIDNTQTLQMSANVQAPAGSYKWVDWSVETLSGNVVATIDTSGILKITSGEGKVRVKATPLINPTITGTMDINVYTPDI